MRRAAFDGDVAYCSIAKRTPDVCLLAIAAVLGVTPCCAPPMQLYACSHGSCLSQAPRAQIVTWTSSRRMQPPELSPSTVCDLGWQADATIDCHCSAWLQVIQIAMGTGFKCVAAAWRSRRSQASQHAAWAPPSAPFRKNPAGFARPRALALAAAQEAAAHGAGAPRARELAAAAAACVLGADGLEVTNCGHLQAKRAAEAVGGDGGTEQAKAASSDGPDQGAASGEARVKVCCGT